MVVIKRKELQVLFFSKYEESEHLANAMIEDGVGLEKVYLRQVGLVDEHTIHFDEIDRTTNVIICDSLEGARLAMICPVNHALYYFLDLGYDSDAAVKEEDFYTIEVKNGKDKKRDDWAEAAVFFRGKLSEGIGGLSNI